MNRTRAACLTAKFDWQTNCPIENNLESRCLLLAFKCQLESSTRQNERDSCVHSSTESHLNTRTHTGTHAHMHTRTHAHTHTHTLNRVWVQWLLYSNTLHRKSEWQCCLVVYWDKMHNVHQCFNAFFLSILCFRLHDLDVSWGRRNVCCWLQHWMLAAGASVYNHFLFLYLLNFLVCIPNIANKKNRQFASICSDKAKCLVIYMCQQVTNKTAISNSLT